MPDQDPPSSMFPRVVHKREEDRTTISEYIEKHVGEVQLDKYVHAQTSAPQVVKRITELENSLWRLADAATQSNKSDEDPDLRSAIEEARMVLNNRLEVDDTKHKFDSELGPFNDDMSLFRK
jgi:C4-dicarboxylate-specific signal transduction histidine kinase